MLHEVYVPFSWRSCSASPDIKSGPTDDTKCQLHKCQPTGYAAKHHTRRAGMLQLALTYGFSCHECHGMQFTLMHS